MANHNNKITKFSIVNRYNDFVYDIANCIRAKIKKDETSFDKSLKDGGEAISQTIEWSLKFHLIEVLKYRSYELEKKFQLPRVINDYYWDAETNIENECWKETIDEIDSQVDFIYLGRNKNLITNISKHGGGDIDFDVLQKYGKEVKKFILDYIDDNALLRDVDYFLTPEIDKCSEFYSVCDKFKYDERIYILITDNSNINPSYYKQFSKINWSLIIEFDKESTLNGFCKYAYSLQNKNFKQFKITDLVTKDTFSPYATEPIVIFANGFKEVISLPTYKEWNKRYSRKLDHFIEEFSYVYENQKTIVVSLIEDRQWVNSLHDMLEKYFDNMKFVITNDMEDKLLPLSKDIGAKHIGISIQDMDVCFTTYLRHEDEAVLFEEYKIPCLPTGNGIISKEEIIHLEEVFEVLYEGIDSNMDESLEDYLIGNTKLSWSGARRKFAVERSRFNKIYVKPIEEAIRHGKCRINILHEPGYGGSTIARQLAWHFHSDYPVLYLKKYRDKIVKEQLEVLHQKTKKPILLFMEIPQSISMEEINYLYNSTNEARPYVFICVKRGLNESIGTNLKVNDWGNDVDILIEKFKPYIENYETNIKSIKETEYENIIINSTESYQKTPFYIGLLTFDERFVAIKDYINKFVEVIKNNEEQRKVLIYLSICDKYLHQGLPNSFFHSVFSVPNEEILKLENYFNENDSIVESLLSPYRQVNSTYWKIKHPFFTNDLLPLLLNSQDLPQDIGWMKNLGTYCKSFIEDVAFNPHSESIQENILKELFIGSSMERTGEQFTKLINDIQQEERINIFKSLHEHFPENPHFCSHLARYYAMVEKNMELAIEYADKALYLSPIEDPLLHHIKGMCLRSIIFSEIKNQIASLNYGQIIDQSDIDYIITDLLEQAEDEFYIARKLRKKAKKEDEYGFIPNIELLIGVIDYYSKINGISKNELIASASEPFITWIEKAQSLLEDVKRIYQTDELTRNYIKCKNKLLELFENYSTIINNLTNQLEKTKFPTLVRRQLARIYMQKDDDFKKDERIKKRILSLMQDNIISEPNNERNFYLWFKAARYSSLSIDEIVSKLTEWKAINPTLDIIFYCYIFQVIKALNGNSEAAIIANRLINNCRNLGGANKIFIKEWYGKDFQHIISNSELKELDKEENLLYVQGYIQEFNHPGSAKILMDGDLEVFFKPSLAGLTSDCLNRDVEFFLGFSYDGLRADSESVKIVK